MAPATSTNVPTALRAHFSGIKSRATCIRPLGYAPSRPVRPGAPRTTRCAAAASHAPSLADATSSVIEEVVDTTSVSLLPADAVPRASFAQHEQAVALTAQLAALNSELHGLLSEAETTVESLAWSGYTLPVRNYSG